MAPNPQIINYIVQYTNLGYSSQSIKQSLLQSGYNPAQIDEAFRAASQSHYGSVKQSGPHITAPNMAIISVFILGILLLAFGGALFFQGLNPQDTSSVLTPSETVRLEPKETPVTKPTTPSTSTQTPSTSIPATTKPTTTTPSTTTTTSLSSTSTLSRLDIDRKVDSLKASNPTEAITWCKKIDKVAGEYSCYAKVALASQNPSYCDLILDAESKDSCYVSLAIQTVGDSSLCANIQNEYKQRSCVELYNIDANVEFTEPIEQTLPAFATEASVDEYTIN